MPGGKIHGQGGHGRFSREARGKYEHEQLAKEKIDRAQAGEERRLLRKGEEVKEIIVAEFNPMASKAVEHTTLAVEGGRVSRRAGAIRLIAVDEWMKDSVMRELEKRRFIFTPEETAELRQKIKAIPPENRQRLMEELVGKGPTQFSLKSLQQEIQKWKQRVEKMAEGHY